MDSPSDLSAEESGFVAAVRAWVAGRRDEEVDSLRARALELGPKFDQRRLARAAPEAAVILNAYRKREAPSLKRLTESEDLAAAFGPFLGDPAMAPRGWAHASPLEIGDDDACRWLRLLSRHAQVDDQVRQFARVLFATRRRELWTEASAALARLSGRDAASRAFVSGEWAACFPAVPVRWGPTLGSSRKGMPAADSHRLRHVYHLACAVLADGGGEHTLGGVTTEALLAAGLPTGDASDASAALAGWVLLARRPALAGAVARAIAAALPLKRWDAFCEDNLRALAAALEGQPGLAAEVRKVEAWLLDGTRWQRQKGAEQADGLHAWLESLAWARDRPACAADIARSIESAGQARPLAIEAARDGRCAPADAGAWLADSLSILVREELFETSSHVTRSVALVSLVRALNDDGEVAALPWPALLARAGSSRTLSAHLLAGHAAADGRTTPTFGNAGRAALALLASERFSSPPALVLRDRELPAAVVLDLVEGGSGYLATQLAVQLERLLRAQADGRSRVHLLWQVLHRRPTVKLLDQLEDVARAFPGEVIEPAGAPGPGRPSRPRGALKPLIAACQELAKPDCGPAAAVEDLGKLVEEAVAVAEHEDVASASDDLRRSLPRLSAWRGKASAPATRWQLAVAREGYEAVGAVLAALARFDLAIRPELPAGAAGGPKPDPDLTASTSWPDLLGPWGELHAALLASETPTSDRVSHERLRVALARMREAVAGSGCAERAVLMPAIELLADWEERRATAAQDLERLISVGDEDGVIASVLGDPRATGERAPETISVSDLPPPLQRRVSEFLLDQYNFGGAWRLWGKVGNLPSPFSRLTPFAAVVAGGAFVVLDIGTVWNDLLASGDWVPVLPMMAGALLLTFGVILTDIWGRMRFVGRAPSRAWRVFSRALLVFLGACAISALVNGVVLRSLDGTSIRPPDTRASVPLQLALWSSLSLFLGVVVNRVMQGKSATTGD